MTPLPLEALKSNVHKQLKKGYPAGELRHELLRQGYALDEIEQAFVPLRFWNNAAEGFGSRNYGGFGGLIGFGLLQLKPALGIHLVIGCLTTGIACLLIKWLHWYENR